MLLNIYMVELYVISDIIQENALAISNCDFRVVNNILYFSMKIWGKKSDPADANVNFLDLLQLRIYKMFKTNF